MVDPSRHLNGFRSFVRSFVRTYATASLRSHATGALRSPVVSCGGGRGTVAGLLSRPGQSPLRNAFATSGTPEIVGTNPIPRGSFALLPDTANAIYRGSANDFCIA